MFVNIINDGRKYLFVERSPEKTYKKVRSKRIFILLTLISNVFNEVL